MDDIARVKGMPGTHDSVDYDSLPRGDRIAVVAFQLADLDPVFRIELAPSEFLSDSMARMFTPGLMRSL